VLDFGVVGPGQAIERELRVVHVRGGSDVRVRSVELLPTQGGGFGYEGDVEFEVAEGDEVGIPIRFQPSQPGFSTATITLLVDAEPSEVSAVVRGASGEGDLDLWPLVLDFGAIGAGGHRTLELAVQNDGVAQAEITGMEVSDAFSIVGGFPQIAPAGVVTTLRFEFSPTSDLPVAEYLRLQSNLGDLPLVLFQGNDCENGPPEAYDRDGDGITSCAGDCDDDSFYIHPGAFEVPNDADDDCNGWVDDHTVRFDDDADGQSEDDGDCDDSNAAVFEGASELADWIDNDCDGVIDEGTAHFDDDGDGATEDGGDCNDGDAEVGPHVLETLNNDVDDDCDPQTVDD